MPGRRAWRRVGPDLRVGDLRGQFDSVFGNVSPAGTKAWDVTYGLGVSETYDDGVLASGNGFNGRFGSDLITRISPNIAISANSSRVQGNIFYAPSLNLYTFHGNQTYVGQNLNGSLTATVVPNLFYIDLRAYAAEQPAYGGQVATNYNGQSQGQVQTTNFSIAPRLEHRFDGTGTLVLSDTLSRTQTSSANNNALPANSAVNPFFPQVVNGTALTNEQHANFTTGEDFGRLQNSLDFLASQTQGSGAVPWRRTA